MSDRQRNLKSSNGEENLKRTGADLEWIPGVAGFEGTLTGF